ncbi:tumor necrosis factor ligand superfamily member 10-like isoform X1 [Dunckerocampus dactyliophorus]|uniref:tumor necrosis factor ligand superfamily member 10-like isoform X1 n=1 Tax=Dunckerocampus dactyliophorus TaxID=161453 RepID=UPI00240639FA|nr:tumor necrosis factor ligand superfamily member 10-like isoform X1 [Dunckerocampus dactyliophorus]
MPYEQESGLSHVFVLTSLLSCSDRRQASSRTEDHVVEGQKGLAFLQDVQLVDGELVVPRPGLYYVYAQTYFRHTNSLEVDSLEEDETVSTYPLPILLMKTSCTSCCSRESQFSLHSAHQRDLFLLSPGDRLFVSDQHLCCGHG